MANVIFIEEQKFRHNKLWSVVLLLPLFAFLIMLLYQIISGELVGDHPMSNLSLFIVMCCYGLPVILIIMHVRLTTIISDESISFGWNIPTKDFNVIKLSDVASCAVVKYDFVGWGYRITRKYGTVYNVDGNEGLQIISKSGYKVLIGTHHAEELKRVIEKQVL